VDSGPEMPGIPPIPGISARNNSMPVLRHPKIFCPAHSYFLYNNDMWNPKKTVQVRDLIRSEQCSVQTEEACVTHQRTYPVSWQNHPEMGKPEIGAFPSHLTVNLIAAPGTRKQAVSLPAGVLKH